jgi:hypothetical protein
MKSDIFRRVGVLVFSLVAASIGSGCDKSCDGGTWGNTYYPVCTANVGGVELNAPVQYGLPATLPVSAHNILDISGPGFDIHWDSREGTIFGVNVSLPRTEYATTYPLPLPDSSDVPVLLYVRALVSVAKETSSRELNLVSGSITVALSSREELRASFEMDFEEPTTGEHFMLSNGNTDVSGCHMEAQYSCIGGD